MVKVRLDITETAAFVREKEIMLYPVLIYLLSLAVAERGGAAHVCYEVYQPGREKVWWLWSAGIGDFSAFYREYVSDYLHYEGRLKPGMPEDVLFVVCDRGGKELASGSRAAFLQNMREEDGRCFLDLRLENIADGDVVAAKMQEICAGCREYLV